ncbi:MAG: DUF6774 domain-containing protein [Lachnospiraceae bacterium]
MTNCSNLFFLSTIACKLADCLSEEELSVLSSDLVVLSDMLANLIARQTCKNKSEESVSSVNS